MTLSRPQVKIRKGPTYLALFVLVLSYLLQQNKFCSVEPRFTFYPQLLLCDILGNCTDIDQELCPDCVTGEKACDVTDPPVCWVTGLKLSYLIMAQPTYSPNTFQHM